MKKIRFLVAALAAGIVAASCDKAELRPVPVPGGGNDTPVTVSLLSVSPEVSVSGDSGAGTKAAANPLAEGTVDARVHNLWAIQYDENGALVGTPYYTANIPAAVAGGSGVDSTYSGLTAQLTGSGGKTHAVYFVANTGSASLFTADNDVSTSAKLHAVVQRVAAGTEWQFDPAKGIPMLGVYSGTVSSSAAISVPLKRLAAKVILKFKSSLSGFTITGVQLRNVASGIYYCPEPASGSDFPAVNTAAGSESHLDYPAEDLAQAVTDGDYQKYTWYVPENLRKATAAVLAAGDRTPDKTDGKATYVEITGVLREGERCRKVTLRAMLGDLGAAGTDYANFDVKRNTVYTVTADIKGVNEGDYRLTVESFDMSNCGMIVPGSGDAGAVTFDIRKLTNGWQKTMPALGENAALRAELLWTDNADLTTQLHIELDKVNGLLTVKSTGAAEGNAVIALYDNATAGSGEILWSWHAWVTGYNPNMLDGGTVALGVATRAANTAYPVVGGQVHTYGTEFQKTNGTSRVIMDRNLGATKTYNETVPSAGDNTADQAFGLFYQWGRKDPFPRSDGATINTSSGKAQYQMLYGGDGTTLAVMKTVPVATALNGANTLVYAVKNPLTFIFNQNISPYDWYTDNSSNQNNNLWGDGGLKGAYDPCPKGWRVPPDGTWSDFTKRAATPLDGTFPYYSDGVIGENYGTGNYTVTNGRFYKALGGSEGADNGVQVWYPASGAIGRADGAWWSVGQHGYNWMSSVSGTDGMDLYFGTQWLHINYATYRSYGFPVRCIQYVE